VVRECKTRWLALCCVAATACGQAPPPSEPEVSGPRDPAPLEPVRSAEGRLVRLARVEGYGDPQTGELWARAVPMPPPSTRRHGIGVSTQALTSTQPGYCTVDVVHDGTPGSNPEGTFEFYTVGNVTGQPEHQSSFDVSTCFSRLPQAMRDSAHMNYFTAFGAGCAFQHVGNFTSKTFEHVYLDVDVFNGNLGAQGPYGPPYTPGTVGTPEGRNAPYSDLGLWDFGRVMPGEGVNMWIYFKNGAATAFNWRGYLLGQVFENCGPTGMGDGVDDDCDGIVDNGCGLVLPGGACYSNADCRTNLCEGAVIVSGLGSGGGRLEDDRPGTCAAVCGDGLVEGGEHCEDGNSVNGDGCDNDCRCSAGYQSDGNGNCVDIDECTLGTHGCHAFAICNNTTGSYTCTCVDGYAGNGVTCTDVDECATALHNCDPNAACLNGGGSFQCVCNEGFTGNGETCADIDECDLGTDDCDPNATCNNTTGSFECVCNDGFAGNGTTCADVDECATGGHDCDPNAACNNTIGSFECTCNGGFTGDGVTCTDIDECVNRTDNCSLNATCQNTIGSFTCTCNSGYTGNGVTCEDVDECAANNGGCSDLCINEPGSFHCACGEGTLDLHGDASACVTMATLSNKGDTTCAISTQGHLYCWGDNGFGQVGDGSTQQRVAPVRVGHANNWTHVSTGFLHTCAIRAGRLYCWGTNTEGQLGIGNFTQQQTPARVGLDSDWTDISVGRRHTCGIRAQQVWCWGWNQHGQLGFTGGQTQNTPGLVSDGGLYSAVDGGGYHSCGLRTNGELWCWGRNLFGQLGQGGWDNNSHPTPARVTANTDWSQVALGEEYTCGLRRGGELWCWGRNDDGELGDGTGIERNSPVRIGDGTDWGSVSAGARFACGLRAGRAYCWGRNATGQLGNRRAISSLAPGEVAGAPGWSVVQAGESHACGLRGGGGGVYCWGDNYFGQVGNGVYPGDLRAPAPVTGDHDWEQVAGGGAHSCGIRAGELYCWGRNANGQVGDGTSTLREGAVQVGTDATWTAVSTGYEHSCGVRDGQLFCWGDNAYGQLGNGSFADVFVPAQTGIAEGWETVSGGGYHTCAIRAGVLSCWGYGGHGQLGNDAFANRNAPVPIVGYEDWTSVAAGWLHTCALRGQAGELYCWGNNSGGQLGDNTLVNRPTPTFIGEGWDSIAAGDFHTCGTRAGLLYCWGSNDYGQLGTSGFAASHVPQLVGEDRGWYSGGIGGGAESTCGILDGALYCWGDNADGQLGLGSNAASTVPAQVGTPYAWFSIGVGDYHACGIRASELYCWGWNGHGQIGVYFVSAPTPVNEHPRVPACPPGMAGSPPNCMDVNECSQNNGGCDPLVTCINQTGTFQCGACPVNYIGDGANGCIPL
jgi:alpha-tubulin suppressor-like RCC1 family protein